MNPWLPQLLQISDSMFPTGAYAHSFGMEGAVQDGLINDEVEFQAFITEMVIPGLEKLEPPPTLPRRTPAWPSFANSINFTAQ